jgi:hypothetical protein
MGNSNYMHPMPYFKHEALDIIGKVFEKYPFYNIASSIEPLKENIMRGIEEKVFNGNLPSKPIPVSEAERVFKKMMCLEALADAYDSVKDGAMTRAAQYLGYSREHFSRECSNLGIATEPFKLVKHQKAKADDFKYFRQQVLEEILSECFRKYKPKLAARLTDSEIADIRENIPLISWEMCQALNELDIYRLYVNRMSFVYKIAADVIREKYEEVKNKPNAYKRLQREFRNRYSIVCSSEVEKARRAIVDELCGKRANIKKISHI